MLYILYIHILIYNILYFQKFYYIIILYYVIILLKGYALCRRPLDTGGSYYHGIY